MNFDAFLRSTASAENGALLTLGIALVAGVLASAVCPCTLPVGVGIASLSGAKEAHERKKGLDVTFGFVAGIVVCLTLLGAVAGRIGVLASEGFGQYWALAMAIISLAAAAVAFLGPRLSVEQLKTLRKPGAAGAFGYGFLFSLGTSVAPLLLLLAIAASNGDPVFGFALAFAFGLGRGLPFLVIGVAAGLVGRFARFAVLRPALQAISGAALLFVSFYYAKAFVALSG